MAHGQQEFIVADPGSSERMDDLVDALAHEATIIEELRQALLRQRAGVATDDQDLVETSIHAVGRTLLTLDEARRHRASLTALMAGESTSIDRLESLFGGVLSPELETARARVKRVALQTSQDIAINQHILRRALEAGDQFLQRLFSMAGDPAPGYQRADGATDATPRSGLILNRTA
jgi:hypothetical protein